MVTNRHKLSRFAFTLIELIFAIVIVSIAVISLPMMTQFISKGVESNIVQEAIFAASTELMGASSGYWDRNSMEDNNVSHISRVIDISGDCNNIALSDRHRLRPGHIAQPLHRRCIDSNTTTPADASDINFPNLDNAEHASQVIFLLPSPEATGYKDDYNSVLDVTRTNDIKFMTVSVTKSNGDLITTLRMQSANIGEIDYFKRRF